MPHRHALIVLYAIAAGVVLGGLAGWYIGEPMAQVLWIGDTFLNALKMMIIPLIVAAVISGVASLGDVRKLGAIGGVTVGYYAITTIIAATLGLILVNIFEPGVGIELAQGAEVQRDIAEAKANAESGIGGIFMTMIQPNLIESAANFQVLPLIIFSIFFAAALSTLGKVGEHVLEFFNGVNEAMMKLVTWLMYFAPIGIAALVAGRFGELGGGAEIVDEMTAVGFYMITVLTGLGIQFVLLLLIMRFIGGRGWSYLVNLLRALLTAFGTASSSATLPITMECTREAGIDPRATKFVLPLGSTVNMNGTALYEAIAAIFIAQAYGVDLTVGQQFIIIITATLAAVGAAGIPEAGLVTMLIVLHAVGLPDEGIFLILAIDWFLDRFRTSVNVWGDAVGATVLDRYLTTKNNTGSVGGGARSG